MKKIFKVFILSAFMVACYGTAVAQNADKQKMTSEQRDEARAMNIAGKLALDDATTKKFVETYSKCKNEIRAVGAESLKKKDRNAKQMTDKETEAALKKSFADKEKVLDIRQKYYDEYSKFLTPKQILRVYELDKSSAKHFSKNKRQRRDARFSRR